VFILFYRDGGWVAAVAATFGAAIAGFMAPSVTSVHSVDWDENGIRGPSKTFGLTLGAAHTEISWSEVVASGKTTTGYWFINTDDGRRIYWSYLYKGYGSLTQALERHCPSVTLPEDMT